VQQPFEQEVASQTHWPVALSHSCPAPQPPHVAPPVPHDRLFWEAHASHTPAAVQQPMGHDVESHWHWPVALLHSWPDGQAAQLAPFEPQEALVSLVSDSQLVPLQQPLQDPPPQVHAPPEHD
jgi:hypothetical protein